MDKKGYWYHITEKNWSSTILLKPIQFGDNWGSDEDGPPRICVAPTIEQCFAAVPYSEYKNSDYKVYKTKHPEIATPGEVDDFQMTNEHWILVPTTFIKILTIPIIDMKNFPVLTSQNLTSQNQTKVINYVKNYLRQNTNITENNFNLTYKEFFSL